MKKALFVVFLSTFCIFTAAATSINTFPGIEPPPRGGEGGGVGPSQGIELGEDFILEPGHENDGSSAAFIQLQTLTGKLKIKGRTSKRFFIKPVDGKKIEVTITDKNVEKALSLKNKAVTVKGYKKDGKFTVVKFK